MPVINRIAEFHSDMTAWRRDLHAHPETAFQEHWTSDFVAARLEEFGIQVHRGMAGTGVVGTLRNGDGPAIGLRADMDGLDVNEENDFDYKSSTPGKMHACGHDGHTAMLLGAARYLAETKRFNGVIHFIFQPAEENEGGAQRMIEDGLFEKFPVESVYGMHNWPGLPVGQFAVKPGPMMASFNVFEITVTGKGTHAAIPHRGVDPVVAACELVGSLQTIVSRITDPQNSAVVSVTQFHAGDTWNVIPETVKIRGTTRAFKPEVHDTIEATICRLAEGIGAAHGTKVDVHYEHRYPPTVNEPGATEIATKAAIMVAGEANVDLNPVPTMGSEDFAFMQAVKPGCYLWIGNGAGEEGGVLHHPKYNFNDEALTFGASYWAALAETMLG